jgi:hypothetical protein
VSFVVCIYLSRRFFICSVLLQAYFFSTTYFSNCLTRYTTTFVTPTWQSRQNLTL